MGSKVEEVQVAAFTSRRRKCNEILSSSITRTLLTCLNFLDYVLSVTPNRVYWSRLENYAIFNKNFPSIPFHKNQISPSLYICIMKTCKSNNELRD